MFFLEHSTKQFDLIQFIKEEKNHWKSEEFVSDLFVVDGVARAVACA